MGSRSSRWQLLLLAACLLQAVASEEPGQPSSATSTVVCDGFYGVLKCPANSLIEVTSAFYGRTSDKYCAVGPRHNYNCDAGRRALEFVAARCNNKQTCYTWTGLNIIGDPCYGTYKYLHVTYSCRALRTVVACDGEPLKLSCPAGKFIWIRDGFYGRTSDEHCARGPRSDYSCSQPSMRDVLVQQCNNAASCDIPTTLMPDPCPGTFKYRTAAYDCMDYQLVSACDNQDLIIRCPSHLTIRVYKAFYGRTSDEFCPKGPISTYWCSSPTTPSHIASSCNYKQTCTLRVYGSAGFHPDPCHGTYKYAYAMVKCV